MMQIEDFMAKLSKQASGTNSRTFNRQTRKIEKLSLNHPNNLGRYQVIPFCSAVTDFPFVTGQVRQISIPRKSVDQSGQESQYNAWIHIPVSNFYQMKDMSGRLVSSLTAEDEQTLTTAISLWEELYTELDGKNKWSEVKDFIRRRNYTLFTGYCLNFWKYGSADPRVSDRQNFSALFMVTTKSFTSTVEISINDKSIMEGGDKSWINRVYNNDLKNRDGFILFSINRDKDRAGFTSSVQHEFGRAAMLAGVEIPQEDFDAGMADPVSLFLGWQASSQDADKPFGVRRLFNAHLIKEASDYMGSMLAAIRAAKAAGTPVEDAMKRVNENILSASQPVQAQQVVQTPTGTEYSPGAAQIDPVSGTSVNNGFPGFGGNGNSNPNFAVPDFNNPIPGFFQEGNSSPF